MKVLVFPHKTNIQFKDNGQLINGRNVRYDDGFNLRNKLKENVYGQLKRNFLEVSETRIIGIFGLDRHEKTGNSYLFHTVPET